MRMDLFKKLSTITWPAGKETAKELQEVLSREVDITPLKHEPGFVAGVDSAFFGDRIISVACLYRFPELILQEVKYSTRKVDFPYIPGLLAFREGPAALEAIASLETEPDLLIFDGQGIAHPRGLGIASFAGVIMEKPSIGCAKSRLVGEFVEPGEKKGSWSPLIHKGKTVGAVLRTQDGITPLFISPGHMIDLEGSINIVMRCAGRYRLIEPVRKADMESKRIKKELFKTGD